MNHTALALMVLATGVGQPAPGFVTYKSRTLKLDIDYKPEQRKAIQQVQLVVSRDEGQTWQVADAVTADKDHFVFTAESDGIYWLNMVIVFRDGKKDPPDVTRVPPPMKLLVDATPPVVRIASARRDGDEVVVEWAVEEKYPNDLATRVMVKPSGPAAVGDWQPIPDGTAGKRSARFKPAVPGPIAVQVVAQDLAGNVGTATQEVPAVIPTGHQGPAVAPAGPALESPRPAAAGDGPLPPPNLTLNPAPPPVQNTAGQVPPPVVPTQPIQPIQPQPGPAVTPAPSAPAPLPPMPPENRGPQPIAETNGVTPSPQPAPPAANVQHINFHRFELQYQVENGPSGLSRIDLYVTQDDGRTWKLWSRHDGRESPLRVVLDTQFNPRPEGPFGFRIVPVSGAGLAEPAPAPGSPPELRVHVDLTPPVIKVFQPTADPANRAVLNLNWEATDANFGRDPILIEWSENPTGPWKPVTAPDPVTPVAGQPAPGALRIPNTGTYPWQLPANLNTHRVYLKFTAWDAAGNRSEVTTPSPVMVDLTKPRARIQGILPGGVAVRP